MTVPCLLWGARGALTGLSLSRQSRWPPSVSLRTLLSLGVAHPMAQLHSKHDPFCTTTVLSPQPGLEELGGSLPWRVLGESCTRCPGMAFARRRESNCSV